MARLFIVLYYVYFNKGEKCLVLATPGFLKDGIDFEQLVKYCIANDCRRIEITDQMEVNLLVKLMERVIGHSYKYNEGFASTINGRSQMIFNSTMQELAIQAVEQQFGLIKRSNAVWLLSDSYERGTDFYSVNNKQIEAKVYKTWSNMLIYADIGSKDHTVFHDADYVLCYLIDRPEKAKLETSPEILQYVGQKHWYWLKRIDGKYVVYFDKDLYGLTYYLLPQILPVCYCKVYKDKIIFDRNTFAIE